MAISVDHRIAIIPVCSLLNNLILAKLYEDFLDIPLYTLVAIYSCYAFVEATGLD